MFVYVILIIDFFKLSMDTFNILKFESSFQCFQVLNTEKLTKRTVHEPLFLSMKIQAFIKMMHTKSIKSAKV